MLSVCLMLLETEEDRKKFSEVYEREHKGLLKYAMSKLNNIEDAEDAVSEAFLRLADKFQNYSSLSCSDFHKLIVTIVRNIILDMFKKGGKKIGAVISIEDAAEEFEAEAIRQYEEIGGLEEHAIQNEKLILMLRELDILSPILRDTFLLKHYVGFDAEMIAKKQGVSVRTVESRLYRATTQIRRSVNTYEDEE